MSRFIRATLSMVLSIASILAWAAVNLYAAYLVVGTNRAMTDGDIIPIAVWSVLAFAAGLKICQFWDRLFGVRDEPFSWYYRDFFKENHE